MKTGLQQIIFCSAAIVLLGCASKRATNNFASGDAELARTTRLARVAWDKGSLKQAETLFREAHRRAREMDNAAELGNAAYNLAAVLIALDRSTEAEPLLDEAGTELKRAKQPATDVLLVKANLALAAQRPAEAIRCLDDIDKIPLAPEHRVQLALLRGEIACRSRNPDEATLQLKLARQYSTSANPVLNARTESLSGEIALLENHPAQAAASFAREAELFQHGKNYRAMAQALARAGDAFEQAGDSRNAAEYFYRAARSHLAQGEVSAAQALILRGKSMAQDQDVSVKARFEQLAREAESGRH